MTNRISDLASLHPAVQDAFEVLTRQLRADTPFLPFETYRSPEDQEYYLAKGTSKSPPWRSAHQYGMAVDFVPFIDGRWTWDVPQDVWLKLSLAAATCGLIRPIKWDLCHVEHPLWGTVRKAWQ